MKTTLSFSNSTITDMMALIASFSGRVYGFRAAALRAR